MEEGGFSEHTMKYHLLMARRHGMALHLHWLWLVLLGFGLGVGIHGNWSVATFLAALLFQALLHETGHALLARWCHYPPRLILLHPLHGRCRYRRFIGDEFGDIRQAMIAWGGVLAQMLLLIPTLLFLLIGGWASSAPSNALLLAWGPVNGLLLLLNLLPHQDGALAWRLPGLLRHHWAQLKQPPLEVTEEPPVAGLSTLEPDSTDLYHMLWLKCFYDEARVAQLLVQEQQRYPRAERTELLKRALSRFDRKLEDGRP